MIRIPRIPQLAVAGCAALVALALLFSPSVSYAGLTTAQIDSLKNETKIHGWTFTISQNPATQYDIDQLAGMKEPANWREGAPFDDMRSRQSSALALPSAFDWRTQVTGGMPPIRNQLSCGSCWAFATTGAFECAIKIKDGQNVDLSEQWLVSCNVHGYGCAGGWWVHDMEYNLADKCGGVGAVLEVNDPYKASDAACACPYPHDYRLDGWSYIGQQWGYPTTQQIKQAIFDHGPVSVAIAVDNAFQSYGGGVFTANTGTSINHAVVLVGWDDSQGPNGVWILRNSWGPYWGESGYMRIGYGVDMVGYNATYVDYRGRVALTADTTLGPVPMTVNFAVQTSLTPLSYAWTFGDGGTSTLATPTHTYTQTGQYTVQCNIQCADGLHAATSYNMVGTFADTLSAPKVNVVPGQHVVVDVYARNCLTLNQVDIPLSWGGTAGLSLDSASTVGLRSNYLGVNQWMSFDPGYSATGIYRLAATAAQEGMPAGAGPILHLFCTVSPDATGSSTPIDIIPIDDGFKITNPTFSSVAGAYLPVVKSGAVVMCLAGDINGDGRVDGADLAGLSSYLTGGGYSLNSGASANVNGLGIVDGSDLAYMVSYLTGLGPAPVCP